MTIKFHRRLLKKRVVQAIFLITLGKQMSNNYGPYFNRNDFVEIS